MCATPVKHNAGSKFDFSDFEKKQIQANGRRSFVTRAGAAAAAGALLPGAASSQQARAAEVRPNKAGQSGEFWPNKARLVISISMQFEAGGQPPKGTDSPFPKVDMPASVPADLAANTWFAYGYREGIPRMLDLWDRHDIKVTSHMIGEAAQRQSALAKDIVARGHEAAGHGPRWSSQYAMSRPQERKFIKDAADMIEKVDGKDFMVVPYTLRNNDILLIEGRNFTPGQFLEQIKLDFDQLFEEGATRRRMMSISAHDRISGTPAMVHVG